MTPEKGEFSLVRYEALNWLINMKRSAIKSLTHKEQKLNQDSVFLCVCEREGCVERATRLSNGKVLLN